MIMGRKRPWLSQSHKSRRPGTSIGQEVGKKKTTYQPIGRQLSLVHKYWIHDGHRNAGHNKDHIVIEEEEKKSRAPE